ncbi:hypothetical protein OKW34_003355 [Paraburkholderia youngii]|uniref:hypothetical protein n=1 Tax=Paraburkholderia youngii TaxID=2782701 RepID=UPI003D2201D0
MIEFHGISMGDAVDALRITRAVIAAGVQRHPALWEGIFGTRQDAGILPDRVMRKPDAGSTCDERFVCLPCRFSVRAHLP